jgi:Ran GTPase-activating protein (RanGAP) involved in mRNA processing and transport
LTERLFFNDRCLSLPNLEELDLSGNKISVAIMNQLVELFKHGAVPKLCKLKLSNTSLVDETVLPLLLFLEESTQQVL